jgi:hypothetical protein
MQVGAALSLDDLKQAFIDCPVGRYIFLTAGDIEIGTGRAAGTVLNDMRKNLIKCCNPGAKFPKFDIGEVHAYLVRIGWIKLDIDNGFQMLYDSYERPMVEFH